MAKIKAIKYNRKHKTNVEVKKNVTSQHSTDVFYFSKCLYIVSDHNL